MPGWEKAVSFRTAINTGAIFGGEALTRLGTLAVALLVARRFGPEGLGLYGYAVSMASILLLLPDMGLHLLTTRELARTPRRLPDLFWNLHGLKIPLVLAAMSAALVLGEVGIQDEGRRALFFILALKVVLQTFSHATMAIFKGLEQMHYIAVQQTAGMLATLLGLALCMSTQGGIVSFGWALVTGQAVETCFGWAILYRRFNPGKPRRRERGSTANTLTLAAAAPVGATGLLQAVSLRLDVLVFSLFAANNELGRLQAGAWIEVIAFLFTSLLMSVLFPKLARLLQKPSRGGTEYVESLVRHGLLLTAVGSVGVWWLAPYLLRLSFGPEFAAATELLRLYSPILPFVLVNTALFYVFVALDRRKSYLAALAGSIVAGFAVSSALAPHWGAAGVVIGSLLREAVLSSLLLLLLFHAEIIPGLGPALLRAAASSTLATILGAIGVRAWGLPAGSVLMWNLALLTAALIFLGVPTRRQFLVLTGERA